jgi:hypothetical protein
VVQHLPSMQEALEFHQINKYVEKTKELFLKCVNCSHRTPLWNRQAALKL